MKVFCLRVLGWVLMSGLLLLAGCDIQPTERINQDDALGEPNTGDLDPEDDENLTAYFYAGKPVQGLIYTCSGAGGFFDYNGTTDKNGRFICPRRMRADFYIGVFPTAMLKIGQVDLSMFGSAKSALRRNNVLITPGTFYGTHVSGTKQEIVNIFNVIYSLDAATSDDGGQAIIDLRSGIMEAAVSYPEFAVLRQDKGVGVTTLRFEARLSALLDRLSEFHGQLVLRGETLGETESAESAREALNESRAGIYRTPFELYSPLDKQYFSALVDMYVDRNGRVSGLAYSGVRFSDAPASFEDAMSVGADAKILDDGLLHAIVFGSGLKQISVTGAIINAAIWGGSRLCNVGSANEMVPEVYCKNQSSDGGFAIGDAGRFSTPLSFEGEAQLIQPLAGLPDIDLDVLLPSGLSLPVTYELTLQKYPDIEFADFIDGSYDEVQEDKAAFGTPLETLPKKLRYTLMRNGDIVSDNDADCENLSYSEGRYVDRDGSDEYVIGRVGSIFTARIRNGSVDGTADETDTFIDLYFNILERDHDFFGFTMGLPSLFRSGLFETALQVSSVPDRNGDIISKKCNPTSTTLCNAKVEWFNNVQYWEKVRKIDLATSVVTAEDERNYKTVPFYGQAADNGNTLAYHASGLATEICRERPPLP